MEPPALQEALVGRLVTLAGTGGLVERLVSGTRLAARALAGVLVEDVVERTEGGGRRVADAPAAVVVQVSVGAAVPGLIPAPTHTLTAFHVQMPVRAAHLAGEDIEVLLGGPGGAQGLRRGGILHTGGSANAPTLPAVPGLSRRTRAVGH